MALTMILAGAVNTAIVGSNGVLNRVSEDGVLPDWFLKPHPRFGTSSRLINLVVILQVVTTLASRGNVLLLVVRQGLMLALIGSAIGIAGALMLSRVMRSQLYGVQPTDPVTFVTVAGLLMVVVLAASYIPARRAIRVDPIMALRYE